MFWSLQNQNNDVAARARAVPAELEPRMLAFLEGVLALEGEISNLLREGVRRHLATCEKQFRDAETNKRMKDRAAQAFRTLCRTRVAEGVPANTICSVTCGTECQSRGVLLENNG